MQVRPLVEVNQAVITYTTSFYGSPLWDLMSADCDRIFRSWNVAIRNLLGVDRRTHRYMIEPLSQSLHPKVMLLSRLVGFYKAQSKSPKMSIRFLIGISENDQRTNLGKTLEYIRDNKCYLQYSTVEINNPCLMYKEQIIIAK